MGTTAANLSTSGTESAEAEAIKVEEPLHEHVRLLASVKAAMLRRQEKKQVYTDAIIDLEVKQAAYNKVLGSVGKDDQVQSKAAAVEKSQAAVDSAKVDFEDVSEKLLEEFERFKKEKTADIRAILLDYANLQVIILSII